MVPVLLVALLGATLSGQGGRVATTGGAAGTVASASGHAPTAAAEREPFAVTQEASLCVVANVPDAPTDVDLDLVRRVFLVRQRFWPDGGAVHPVNLPASSTLREQFSAEVFGQSVKDMVPYWNDRYFHGTRPPPTVASEAAVLLFVERTPGGVGYVSQERTGELPEGVRVLLCVPPVDRSAAGTDAGHPGVSLIGRRES